MRREEGMGLGGDGEGGEYGQNTWYKFFKELNKINIKIKGIRRLKWETFKIMVKNTKMWKVSYTNNIKFVSL